MAEAHLRQEDLKALEQTRQKFFQLSSNLLSLGKDIQEANPLPDWESLQASSSILANSVRNLTDHMVKNADLFQRVAVHPSVNFPGRTQEHILIKLLNKKLSLPVEAWVEEGRATQAASEAGSEKEDKELWGWARGYIGERVAKYAMEEAGSNYTAKEREEGIENVRTGLKRKLEDDEESEEDDDEDEDVGMEDVGLENTTVIATKTGEVKFGMEEIKAAKKNPNAQARRLSEIMRYVTTGDPVRHYPSDKELEAKANKSKDFSFS